MAYKLSRTSRERLEGVHPSLIALIDYSLIDSPYDFGIPKDGGARTLERQAELYAIGRTTDLHKAKVTWTLNSKHRIQADGYGHAFDIYAYVDGKASWNRKHLTAIANHILKCSDELDIKIEWGGKWKSKDMPHFQLID